MNFNFSNIEPMGTHQPNMNTVESSQGFTVASFGGQKEQQQEARNVVEHLPIPAEISQDYKDMMELSKFLCNSSILPSSSSNKDVRAADTFNILDIGRKFGMNPSVALSSVYIINGKLGLYVKTKEGICLKHGDWSVTVADDYSSATATGRRFSNNKSVKVVYTAQEAERKGCMAFQNGKWVGTKRWQTNYPEMLKTRALGRLLDTLFPDILIGISSVDDINDEMSLTTDEPKVEAPKVEVKKSSKSTAKRLKAELSDAQKQEAFDPICPSTEKADDCPF